MARVYVSSVIDAPAAKVWERVRDFNGLPRWHPRIRDSRIENGEPADRVPLPHPLSVSWIRHGSRSRRRRR